MAEPREVCKICFGSTSHKPNPTLTPESKATYDNSSKKLKCGVCRQEWAPIRVTKEDGAGPTRWVRIRPRPKIPANIDFQICKNVQQGKGECMKGQDCSYAHSRAELQLWNQEREKEPRPAPSISGPYQYQLCKHMLGNGVCPYGQRCTFAHSDEELQSWLQVQAGVHGAENSVLQHAIGAALSSVEFRCDICNLNCTSRKQLDDHISGTKHKQQVASRALHDYHNPTPAQSMGRRRNMRRRPLLSFPINGYKLCLHTQAGRRCIYGDYCTFAHSQFELEEWNRQLRLASAPRVGGGIVRFQANAPPGQTRVNVNPVPVSMVTTGAAVGGIPPGPPGGQSGASEGKPDVISVSGLDDFEDELSPECQDFAFQLRSKIATQQKQKQEIQGFERTRESVTITELSGTALELMWNKQTNVTWLFEISVSAPRVLHSLVLFDMLAADFSLEGVWLLSHGGQQRPLDGTKALQGVGKQLNQRLVAPDKIHVKISLKPRSGILGQLVVFDFGGFQLVRGLCVHVLKEHEASLLQNAGTPRQRKPEKPDLYWEQRYSQIPMASSHAEETDKSLADYPLPEQVERLIDAGKYNNVENRVTRENYKRRMHNLLYLEEYQQRVDMSRYDLYGIEITPTKEYRTPQGVTYGTDGTHFIIVSVDEVLYEGGRSIRPGDGALLLPMNQTVIHECSVVHVARETVVLKITEKAQQASAASLNQVSIRFCLSRIQMRAMHYAVDQLHLEAIFPLASASSPTDNTPAEVKKCLEELKGLELNTTQKLAVSSMLDPVCRPIPSLVLGPFGCGKTRTLGECVKLLVLHQKNSHVLICTHSNSAANLYVESMDQEWRKRFNEKAPLFRLYYIGRRLNTVPATVRPYCKIESGELVAPSPEDLRKHRIVVATLQTSRVISLMGLPKGHFSHVFIDEAAQALEAETLVPLSLANERTKIVLAGDHMQMDPPVYSDIAKKYGLQISLLERLYDHEAYDTGVGQLCKTLLTENHRSHQQILELPSKLFYKNKLTCKAIFPSSGPKDVPALTFIGVDGQESQEEDSPSYFNNHEAMKIADQVQLLVTKGLEQEQVCVVAYYSKQVVRIRYILRQRRLGQVPVHRVDDIQGREYRALLVSTVRTCSSDPLEEEAGFLNNPKLFNTAVTRAREWLMVVGEPITLCTVGSNRTCWLEFIKQSNELGSFDYPNAEHFEGFLETRLVARQILEKSSGHFLKRTQSSSQQPSQPTKVPTSTSQPHPPSHPPSHPPPHTSTTNPQPPAATIPAISAGFMQAGPQGQQQILRSKIHQVAQSGDDVTINRIIGEILKLSVEQQALWLSKPDFFTYKVREMEQVLRRAGPTAAVMNTARIQAPLLGQSAQINPHGMVYPNVNPKINPSVNPYPPGVNPANQLGPVGSGLPPHSFAALTSDLPIFITRMIEALTMHAKFCDHQLQTFPHCPPEFRDNLLKQKANLHQQMKLVNDQISLYRELVAIYKATQPQPSNPAPVPAPGPAPTSIPTHMPSALPPTTPVTVPISMSRPPMPQMHPRAMPGGMVRAAPMIPGTRMLGMGIRPGMQPRPQPHLQPHPQQPSHFPSQPHPQINSAFTYGVSANVGNSQDLRFTQSQPHHQPLSVQTDLASQPRGVGSAGKRRSPFDAAINRHSSPHSQPPVQDELYISDDELEDI